MNGFINKPIALTWAICGLAALGGGCDCYRNVVDPCYPQRYNAEARENVISSIAPQVNNGHVLDQTVWSYQFEAGSDKLNSGGVQQLAYFVRRRPAPDPVVYVQTAQDLTLDANNLDKFGEERAQLDAKRVETVRKTLAAMTTGRGQSFEVMVHDPHEVGMSAIAIARQDQLRNAGMQGSLQPSASSPQGGAGATAGSGGSSSGGH
jgi:hypothetical protein